MGFFTSKKKKAEKEAARAAEAARQAAALRQQQEKSAQIALAAKNATAVEKQDMVITETRGLRAKITLWEKKVAKLQADRSVVLQRLSAAKQKGLKLDEVDKRKLAKLNRDLKLTQSQLETLENKLSGIEQATANEEVINVVDGANKVTETIAPSLEKVEDVLAKVDEQQKDIEDTNLAFLVGTTQNHVDEEDILNDLEEFEIEHDIGAPAKIPAASDSIPNVPATNPVRPQRVTEVEEDEEEAEMRKLEQNMAAI